jgi:hypothetical protein
VLVLAVAGAVLLYTRGTFAGMGLRPAPAPVALQATATPSRAATTPPPATAAPSNAAVRTSGAAGAADSQLVVVPAASNGVGWWSDGEVRGNHIGDSFLYAGHDKGQNLVSLVRFDLKSIPRSQAILEGSAVRLTGLDAKRLVPSAGGTWSVDLLAADSLGDLAGVSFDAATKAPAVVTLSPVAFPADLGRGIANSWPLSAEARRWLQDLIARGVPYATIRLTGPTTGPDTAFAWDSGAGPVTAGAGPQLRLLVGSGQGGATVVVVQAGTKAPPPSTATITPGKPVGVHTPTPANVFTAAANAFMATSMATRVGTYTPMPADMVTATPLPDFLATAVARGYSGNLAPVVFPTAVPGNRATAEMIAMRATAVALTTGTFTPVPTNAVTPVIIAPTPWPKNAMTAMAQSLMATVQVQNKGTSTPLPFNAIIATATQEPLVATMTPRPSGATVTFLNQYATAVAYTTGTFTPMPAIITPTPTPLPPPTSRPTALPLMVYGVQPRPTPVPPGSTLPTALRGKILFHTDRASLTEIHLYMLDLKTGQLAWITQGWPYLLAQAMEGSAPGGKRAAFVRPVDDVPQIFVRDVEFQLERQLTSGKFASYDPAWSPKGDRIVFVSNEAGNDEIYTMNPDGTERRRLTTNTWEWDKHPSWSPDGTQIVFWSNRGTGRSQLWVMNGDGSNQRVLLDTPYNDTEPIWVK